MLEPTETVAWDGIIRSTALHEADCRARHALADAAKDYRWASALQILGEHRALINTTRPDGDSLFAPLHQAAHGGAPMDVIEQLIGMGAWRTLQNARGERPIDVATRMKHSSLLRSLGPVYRRDVPLGILLTIQAHFHAVIRERAGDLVNEHALRLPALEPLLELQQPEMWFSIPGMYGGFSFRLDGAGCEAKLISESWIRIVGGSGQRHEITSAGSKLVEEGFV